MRLYSIVILALLGLGLFLYNQSHQSINHLSESVSFSESSRTYLLAHSNLNRLMSFATSGVLIKNSLLLDQSLEHLSFANKIKNKKPINQNEFLTALKDSEDIGLEILNKENREYGPQFQETENLINSLEKAHMGFALLFTFSRIGMSFIFYLELKNKKYALEISRFTELQGKLFSSFAESVFYVDKTGTILTSNQSGAKLAQKDIRELLGTNMANIFPYNRVISKNQGEHETLQSLIAKGSHRTNINLMVIADQKESWYKVSMQPVMDQSKKKDFALIASLVDISSQIAANKMIKEQQLRIYESSKMQAIGELAGGIAHEINNPLSVIMMAAESLETSAESNEPISGDEVLQKTNKIFSTVDRISKTVRGLLKMSRGEDNEMSETLLSEIYQMTEEFCHTFDANISFEHADEEMALTCNSTQISQVLINLIKNSVHAISGHQDRWVTVSHLEKGSQVEISVTDSGKGIPKDIAEKNLLPFFTTKSIGKGTGLGLSISRSIVEEHGGTLEIDSNHPNTCFIITLPKSIKTQKDSDESFKDVA